MSATVFAADVDADILAQVNEILAKEGITQAEMRLSGYEGEYVIADKEYDSRRFIQHVSDSGMAAVIPPAPTASNHAGMTATCTGNATWSSVIWASCSLRMDTLSSVCPRHRQSTVPVT